MSATGIDLNQPLPYPSRWRWGYQHYPVYSGMWWRGRALVFGLGVLIIALMTGLGMLISFTDKAAALVTTLVMFVGLAGMAFTGATLCTLARRSIAASRAQQVAVTCGFVCGCLAALAFDAWSSHVIEKAFLEHSAQNESIQALTEAQDASNTILIIDAAFATVLYFWLASGIAFVRYWREPGQVRAHENQQALQEARASRSDMQSRLSMLQAQIEPHFLFNSLASIKSSVRSSPELAESSIDDFVEYLRASIPRLDDHQRAQPTSLKQQVSLCEKYLKVMQLRMGERLRFSTDVDPVVEDKPFPPFLIISLVENAIKHGLEPKSDGGTITIKALLSDGSLLITVEDSGVGLQHGAADGLSSGLGLANIREQLAILFGERGSLSLESNALGGATATVKISEFVKEPLQKSR